MGFQEGFASVLIVIPGATEPRRTSRHTETKIGGAIGILGAKVVWVYPPRELPIEYPTNGKRKVIFPNAFSMG